MNKTYLTCTVLILMALLAVPVAASGLEQAATATPTSAATGAPTGTVTATATLPPTFTPQATYTPLPTYTPQPTFTPLPTQPLPTAAPTVVSTATPTAAPMATPTSTPRSAPQAGFEVGDKDGKLVFGGSYTLRSGERLDGDLVVFGGIARMEEDTYVHGNMVVIGGEVDTAGHVSGDLVLIGGVARLRSSAQVDGQLVRVGGALDQEVGAEIRGGESGGIEIPPAPPVPPVPSVPFQRWANDGVGDVIHFIWRVARAVGTTVLLALLALFALTLWREPMERVKRTITNYAGISWVVGALTPLAFAVVIPAFAVLSALLIIACGLGLIGLLIIAAAALVLTVAWLMGWIALGQIVGERLLRALGSHDPTPAAAATVGTAAITLLWMGLDSLNALGWLCGLGCLGGFAWVIFVVLAPIGLGAVVLTRFGTQDYGNGNGYHVPPTPPAPPAAPVPPSAPEPPEVATVEPPVALPSETTPTDQPPATPPEDQPAGTP